MLLVIESPNKIKKMKGYINAQILATVGHFKDLPQTEMGVDLDTYAPVFVRDPKKEDRIKQIISAAKGEEVYIATDPDREGFAIGTMVHDEIHKVAKSIYRLEINEVTQKGLDDAMAKKILWSQTNPGLYDAFQGRRVGDRLVGYILSPIATRALREGPGDKRSFSVGRVQAPAVRLCVDREREIRNFRPEPFYVVAIALDKGGIIFNAAHTGGNFKDKKDADLIIKTISDVDTAKIIKVETKETKQNPRAPFTTVDMQASASSQLKLSPETSMKLAQQLFEAGMISYHRTDSVRIADEFITEIRDHVRKRLGVNYIPAKPHVHKSKNSQADAHEAIRPTHMHDPADIPAMIAKEGLKSDHERLYSLIYWRTVASQMAAAVFDSTTVDIKCAGEPFKATGRVQKFDGFLSVFSEIKEGGPGEDDDDNQKLPRLTDGEVVPKVGQELIEKTTKAPGRYSEATLVKALEKHGIGRPSTYASIIGRIKTMEYIKIVKSRIHATDVGEKLYDFLIAEHPWVVDLDMTKRMEEYLDMVEAREKPWTAFVKGVHNKMGFARPPARGGGGGAAGAAGETLPPTEPQINYAQKLSAKLGRTIPEDALKSMRVMSALIEEMKKELPPAEGGGSGGGEVKPPTEAQIKYAEGLCKKAGKAISPEAMKSVQAMSALINELLGKSGPGGSAVGGSAGAKKRPAAGAKKPGKAAAGGRG